MGALRTAVDNFVAALQDPAVRAAASAIDPKWPGIFDTIATDLTTQRASIPNNDRLDLLSPAQLALIDRTISGILDRMAFVDGQGRNTDILTPLPAASLYNVADAVGQIRDACRQLVGHTP